MMELPDTTPERYLTGMTALNIPAPDSSGGDWHFFEAFYGRGDRKPKIFVAGLGEDLNTNAIWGSEGIYECSALLRKAGLTIPANRKIFAANHFRAVVDMLYQCVTNDWPPHHLIINDWFNNENEIKQLMGMVMCLKPYLNTAQWQLVLDWLTTQQTGAK